MRRTGGGCGDGGSPATPLADPWDSVGLRVEQSAPLVAQKPGARGGKQQPPELGSGWWSGYVQAVKSTLGIGLLCFPYGFSIAGWLASTVSVLFISVLVLYSLNLLITTSDILRRTSPLAAATRFGSYTRIAFHCGMSNTNLAVVAASVVVAQIGTTSGYLLFIASNVHHLAPDLGHVLAVLLVSVPLILPHLLPRFEQLVPFSCIGLFSLAVALLALFWHCASGDQDGTASLDAVRWGGLFRLLGIATFASEGIVSVPAIQCSMKESERHHTASITAVSMYSTALLFIVVGIAGWICFGDNVASVISQPLPNTAVGVTARVALCVYLWCTFPLQTFPLVDELHGWMYPDHSIRDDQGVHGTPWESHAALYSARMACLAVSVFIACFVRGLGAMLALVGWMSFGFLSFVAPPLMYLSVSKTVPVQEKRQLYGFLLFGIVFSVVGFTIACVESVSDNSSKDKLQQMLFL